MNRKETIQEIERLNKKFESKYFPLVEKAIKSQISSLISTIEAHGVNAGVNEAHKIVTSPVAPVVQSLYLEVGLRYARKQWRLFQEQKKQTRSKSRFVTHTYKGVSSSITAPHFETKGFGFNAERVQFIKDYLYRFLVEKIVFKLAETTRETLLTVLNKAVAEGWGIDETVRELKDLPLSRTQAARIVRTEITRASNTGTMAAGSTFEFEQTKEWMSAHDSRTRGQHIEDLASHIGLDGITIDYEDLFTDPRNGDKLRYPGDPEASAASTINCRCSIAVVGKIGSDGRLIPKK